MSMNRNIRFSRRAQDLWEASVRDLRLDQQQDRDQLFAQVRAADLVIDALDRVIKPPAPEGQQPRAASLDEIEKAYVV